MRPPELTAAMKRMRCLFLPATMPDTSISPILLRHRKALVEQLLAPFQLAAKSDALLQGHASTIQLRAASVAAAQAHCQRDGKVPAECSPHAAKRAKRCREGASMGYFLQLQGARAAAAEGAGQQHPGNSAAAQGHASSSSSGEDTADAVDLHLRQPSTHVHPVELPSIHLELLRLLHDDEKRLVHSVARPAVAHEVARSDFLSVDVLQQALEQAAGASTTCTDEQHAPACSHMHCL